VLSASVNFASDPFPAAILLFYGEGGREKIAMIELKRGRRGQTEVQRARGHCASSSRVGLLVSFLSLESQASFDPRVNNSDRACYPVCDDGYCLYLWIPFPFWKCLMNNINSILKSVNNLLREILLQPGFKPEIFWLQAFLPIRGTW